MAATCLSTLTDGQPARPPARGSGTGPPSDALDGGAALAPGAATPTIGGTRDVAPGSIVLVTVGSTSLSALVQAGGFWNVTPLALAEGTHLVTAAVVDLAGNRCDTETVVTAVAASPRRGTAKVAKHKPAPAFPGVGVLLDRLELRQPGGPTPIYHRPAAAELAERRLSVAPNQSGPAPPPSRAGRHSR